MNQNWGSSRTLLAGVAGVSLLFAHSFAFAADSSTKVSGFIDPQYRWTNKNLPSSKTFLLQDAALYATHTGGIATVMLDLPFETSGVGNNFAFGVESAQAWVEVKHENGFRWKLGQFDTPYGFEVNDTADLNLTSQGIIFNRFDPFTHTGLLAGYDVNNQLGFNLLVANPMNIGLTNGANPEFGVQFVFRGDGPRLAAGVIYQKGVSDPNMLVNVVAGYTAGATAIDAEFNLRKVDGRADDSTGFLLNVAQTFSETVLAAARFELANKELTDSSFTAAVGPTFTLTPNLRLRGDYVLASDTPLGGGDAVKSHSAALSTVYRF